MFEALEADLHAELQAVQENLKARLDMDLTEAEEEGKDLKAEQKSQKAKEDAVARKAPKATEEDKAKTSQKAPEDPTGKAVRQPAGDGTAKKEGTVKKDEQPKAVRPSTGDGKPNKDEVKATKDAAVRSDKQPEAVRPSTGDDRPKLDAEAKEGRKAAEAKESKEKDKRKKASEPKTPTEGAKESKEKDKRKKASASKTPTEGAKESKEKDKSSKKASTSKVSTEEAEVRAAHSELSTIFGENMRVREIARGTHSRVYAWTSPSDEQGQEVAVKAMQPKDKKEVAWIQNEISINALLAGRPSFVKMHRATPLEHVGVGQVCLIEMELCAGSLEDFIVKGDINMGWLFMAPFDVRIRFFYEIARAVAELAEEGIIHRDLKPANVLIRGDPKRLQECTAVLADFGSACKKEKSFSCSPLDGSRLASPAFIAPEAWNPDNEDTPARDVWSLGIILFRLITGRYPYFWHLSEDLDHNIHMLQNSFELRQDPFFRMIKKQEPKIARLISQMLDLHPEDRISAEEVVQALEKYALESDIDLKPSLPLPRWRSLMRKLRPAGLLGRRRKDARSAMFK